MNGQKAKDPLAEFEMDDSRVDSLISSFYTGPAGSQGEGDAATLSFLRTEVDRLRSQVSQSTLSTIE
jgi:hypothetical protein